MTTKNTIALAELAEKGADADLLRDMIQFVAQRMYGDGRRELVRRVLRREKPGTAQQPQRLPRETVGDACGVGGSEDPQAAQGQLLPRFPRAAPHGRESPRRRDPGSVHPGRLHPLGGRAGQGDGHGRDQQEPGLAAVHRDLRAGARVPGSADRGRLAVPCGSMRPT